MSKGFSVFVNIAGRLDKSLSRAVNSAESMLSRLGQRFSDVRSGALGGLDRAVREREAVGKRIGEAGRAATSRISAPTGLLAFGASKMAFDFEKAGNALEALGDATAEQRKQFELYANDLNKKYPQTLAGIIKTGNEMLKGGFSFDQMRGALDQTLATAVLGEMEPAEVGNMMSRTINSFQLPMKTYEEAMRSSQRVSDQMTLAAVRTTASLRDMGEAYRYIGGAASAGGISLEKSTALIMAMAKNGSVGSDAGVALRSAIVRLVKMPPKALAALESAGMKLGDYVGGGRKVTADNVLSGLQADGIDASPVKKQIEAALNDKRLAGSPVKLSAAITKLVQSAMQNAGSAIDASTIAQSVQDSITVAGSKIDLIKFFTDLKTRFEAGSIGVGHIATILEGRHVSRYMPIIQSNLHDLMRQVVTESEGFAQSRYGIMLKGIVGSVYEFGAALEKLSVSFGRAAFPTMAQGISALADAIGRFSEMPGLVKLSAAVGAAAVALGPFLIAAGATVRVAGLLARGLWMLTAGASLSLAGGLLAAAKSLKVLGAVLTFGLVARVRALAAGLVMLSATGGAKAVMAAMAASVATLGRALLVALAPTRLFAAALGVLRVALIGTGIGAALVGIGLAGAFIYRNWNGIGKAFVTFKAGFMAALGPEARGALAPVISLFGRITQAMDDLTRRRPDGTWMRWGYQLGRALGQAAASLREIAPLFEAVGAAWNKFKAWVDSGSGDLFANTKREFEWWGALPGRLSAIGTEFVTSVKGLAQSGYDALTNFDWAGAGKSVVEGIAAGIKGAAGALADALKGAVSGAWKRAKGAIGLGPSPAAPGAPPAASAPGAPAIAGARALGGPVTGGLPYLVGERGPEIFVPATSGRIETNGVLNSIAKAGGRAAGSEGLKVGVDATAVERAGQTAKAAGVELHAALDATRKPIVDTTSINAATKAAEKLKAVLASVGAGTIEVGRGASGSEGGSAESAVGRAVRGGSAAAVAGASSGMGGGRSAGIGSAAVEAGRASAGASGSVGETVTVNGHRYRAGADSEGGRSRVASWLGFLRRPVEAGGLGLDADKSRAMVAMMQGESHANLNPSAMGDYRGRTPTAFGTAQWRLDRFEALKRTASAMGRHWSDVEAQQAHFRNEMLGSYRRVYDAVRAAPSGEHALAVGIDRFENPAKKALAYRFRRPYLDTLRRQEAGGALAAPASRPGPKAPIATPRPAALVAQTPRPAPAATDAGRSAAEAGTVLSKGAPVAKLAGARAEGGPVGRGLSYLVGERGPEIFTPGASGAISTNGALARLTDLGSRMTPEAAGGAPSSIAPPPSLVAQLRPQGGNVSTRGDTNINNEWHIHGADKPAQVQRQLEAKFFDLVRQHESDQRGLLSD